MSTKKDKSIPEKEYILISDYSDDILSPILTLRELQEWLNVEIEQDNISDEDLNNSRIYEVVETSYQLNISKAVKIQ